MLASLKAAGSHIWCTSTITRWQHHTHLCHLMPLHVLC